MLQNCSYNNGTIESDAPVYDLVEASLGIGVNILGAVFNLINVCIFSRGEFQNSRSVQFDLFKFILLKSVIDVVQHSETFVVCSIAVVYKYEEIKLVAHKAYYIAVGIVSTSSDSIEIIWTIVLVLSISEPQSDSCVLAALRSVFTRLGFFGIAPIILAFAVFVSIPRMIQQNYFTMCVNFMSDYLKFW